MAEPLFSVRGLKVALPDMTRKPLFGSAPMVEILKGLDLDLPRHSVTGIVGESGSGKSTLGRTLVRLIEPAAGTVHFEGRDIAHLSDAELKPLRSFVLPGGSAAAAALHVSRTVCRRAERCMVELAGLPDEPVSPAALKYINRLSDLLFVASRYVNARGEGDVLWVPGKNR